MPARWQARLPAAWKLAEGPRRHAGDRHHRPRLPINSSVFTEGLTEAEIRISTDGCGRWLGTLFPQRLWRLYKDACVSVDAFQTGSEVRAGIG